MLSLLIFDRQKKEGEDLRGFARDAMAYQSEDELRVECLSDIRGMEDYLEGKNLMDMAFLDLTARGGTSLAVRIRRTNEETEILILADASISPMEYLNPSVRAASLLLRPFSESQGRQVVGEFFRAYYRDREEDTERDKMVLESREGRLAIPFSKIYYLEVREKRVYVRLKNTEYYKYGNLTQVMEEELSDRFIRCHRSFAVNKDYIRQVKLTEGIIGLADDMEVPLSRSYKKAIREYLYELRKQ